MLEEKLEIKMNYKQLPWRESDQKVFVADYTKAQKTIGWEPIVSKEGGLNRMLDWLK